jgi:hypothetical protein
MHARKHPLEIQQTPEAKGEILVPVVHQLPSRWQTYLVERRVLDSIKEALDLQKEKLKPYAADVKTELLTREKGRWLFYIDPSQEGQYGSCAGLRAAKRTRTEQLSEPRMEEVTINAIKRVFQGKYSDADLQQQGKDVCKEILKQRTRDIVYTVEPVRRKGVGKPAPKKRKEVK